MGMEVNLFFLTILGSVAGLLGGILFLYKNSWSKKLVVYSIPFAAGVLLTVSFLHLIPEASEVLGKNAYVYVLVSFLACFVFEKYLTSMHHHEGHSHGKKDATVALVIAGDTIHNFIDGVAIGAAYITNPSLGVVVAISTFLHEIPHEIGDFGVLIKNGLSKTKTIYANFASALSTIVGAFLVYWFFPNLSHENLASVLAIAAGIFLYLGASDFLPEVEEDNDTKKTAFLKILFVLGGVAIIYFFSLIFPD